MHHQDLAVSNNTEFLRPLLRWLWRHAWLLLPLLALPAVWPLLTRGLTASADGELHLFRMIALGEQVRKGVLFPCWVPELYTGLGYPLFNYYAPLSYYPGVLLHALGFSYASSLVLSFCILILAGGLGTYRLALDIFGERFRGAALVAAVAYMLTPYLLTNVYIRGAIAEVAAQALLPWIFWSVRRLLTSQEPIDYLVPTVLTLRRPGRDPQHYFDPAAPSYPWLRTCLVVAGRQKATAASLGCVGIRDGRGCQRLFLAACGRRKSLCPSGALCDR